LSKFSLLASREANQMDFTKLFAPHQPVELCYAATTPIGIIMVQQQQCSIGGARQSCWRVEVDNQPSDGNAGCDQTQDNEQAHLFHLHHVTAAGKQSVQSISKGEQSAVVVTLLCLLCTTPLSPSALGGHGDGSIDD
jgi:hypothetical protein